MRGPKVRVPTKSVKKLFLKNNNCRTDALIQRAVRECSSLFGVTVISIAHRVSTVMDSDKILVMEDGRVEVRR